MSSRTPALLLLLNACGETPEIPQDSGSDTAVCEVEATVESAPVDDAEKNTRLAYEKVWDENTSCAVREEGGKLVIKKRDSTPVSNDLALTKAVVAAFKENRASTIGAPTGPCKDYGSVPPVLEEALINSHYHFLDEAMAGRRDPFLHAYEASGRYFQEFTSGQCSSKDRYRAEDLVREYNLSALDLRYNLDGDPVKIREKSCEIADAIEATEKREAKNLACPSIDLQNPCSDFSPEKGCWRTQDLHKRSENFAIMLEECASDVVTASQTYDTSSDYCDETHHAAVVARTVESYLMKGKEGDTCYWYDCLDGKSAQSHKPNRIDFAVNAYELCDRDAAYYLRRE